MHLKPLFSLWLLIIVCFICNGQTVNIRRDSVYHIAPYSQYIIDKADTIDIEELLSKEFDFEEKNEEAPIYTKNFSKVWCKFKLNNRTNGPVYLTIHNPVIDTVLLYQVQNKKIINTYHGGYNFPYSIRQVKVSNIVFVLPENIDSSSTFYLQMHVTLPRHFPITVANHSTAEKHSTLTYFFNGIFYGLLLINILFNLIAWIKLKERTIFLYTFYLIGLLLTIGNLDGFTFQFLWPSYPIFNQYPAFFPAVASAFAVGSMLSFLELKKKHQTFYKIANVLIALCVIGASLSISGFVFESIIFIRIVILVGCLFYIIVGYHFWIRGFKPARFFMLAWCTFVVFVALYILNDIGFIPYNLVSINAIKIGTVLQLLLLALAFNEKLMWIIHSYTTTLERYKVLQHKKDELEKSIEKTVIKKVDQKTNELKKKDELKNQVFSIISHDLKTPVNSLQMVLSLLDSKTLSETEARDLMDKIKLQVSETGKMMDNIIEWSRNQLTGFRLNKTAVHINETINNVIKGLHLSATAKDIAIKYSSDLNIVCNADEDIFSLIVRNLLTNAIKFSPAHSVIDISSSLHNNILSVIIKDKGIGIPAERMSELFDFTKKYTTLGTANELGSGLGLKLAYEFAKAHGGSINMTSEHGKGSVFSFTLTVE